ncbi:MAG TPA: HesA/MoeB/ThiF family protein [Planctomycetaceae bacterium]|nr:HesA/MoeB/ThiF family protein [Planctomycetaceae bacterium]
MSRELPPLTDDERARYEWQMWSAGVGEEGQRKLKAASVLISRIGGVGGAAAYHLAAAGVGRLVLAHAGVIQAGDLNRQLLMTTDRLGTSRVESAAVRLRELNPLVEIVTIDENVNESNAARLVEQADVIVDAAPRFGERLAMNRAAVRLRKPMVEAAMYEFDVQLTTFVPGRSPCLACLYPEEPPHWRREFPVFGAVAGTAGALAATEVIKLITGVGDVLVGTLLCLDLRTMESRRIPIARDPGCSVCG